MKTVTLKNTGSEPLAFAGLPLIQPNATFEVTEEQSAYLLKNDSVKLAASEKKTVEKSFTAVEV